MLIHDATQRICAGCTSTARLRGRRSATCRNASKIETSEMKIKHTERKHSKLIYGNMWPRHFPSSPSAPCHLNASQNKIRAEALDLHHTHTHTHGCSDLLTSAVSHTCTELQLADEKDSFCGHETRLTYRNLTSAAPSCCLSRRMIIQWVATKSFKHRHSRIK